MKRLLQHIDSRLPHSGENVAINQEVLESIFAPILGESLSATQTIFYTDATLDLLGESSADLSARTRGWKFHVSRSIAQSAVSGVVMAILLKTVTEAPVSLAVIPAILPYLVQVEKTELTIRDEELLLHLYEHVGNRKSTANELYNSLPQEIKDQVNKLDLLEFLGVMMQTGHAKENQRGVFQLRHPDHPRFVISFV